MEFIYLSRVTLVLGFCLIKVFIAVFINQCHRFCLRLKYILVFYVLRSMVRRLLNLNDSYLCYCLCNYTFYFSLLIIFIFYILLSAYDNKFLMP